MFDTDKFANVAQVGGIESYVIDEGPARGVRALVFNTGGGLRFRVLVDRGMDIDQAFMHQHSLSALAHKGPTPPTRGLDRGLDWLKGFPVGLLTSCGPFNTGAPDTDAEEELGLHGPHSNTAAAVESVVQPDPRRGQLDMSVTGTIRYGAWYGPNIELRRTISCTLGSNRIDITDEFFNAGNTESFHAWLLHVNFGYPLLDRGSVICFDAARVEAVGGEASIRRFGDLRAARKVPSPLKAHDAETSYLAYLYPKSPGRDRQACVGIVNPRLSLGVAIHYSTREFPRCGCWQHFGRHEYTAALEPMTGGVQGRSDDRRRGWLNTIEPGRRKTYRYRFDVLTEKKALRELLSLNR